MRRACLLIAFAIGLVFALPGQNLIPNPGFEEMKKCPKGLGQIDRCLEWSSPNTGTPDFFHRCYTKDPETVGVPNNFFGTRAAFEGGAYAGILSGNQEKEYLQVRLTEPLVAGRRYCLRFQYVAPSAESDGRKALRAYFADSTLAIPNWNLLDLPSEELLETNGKIKIDADRWCLFAKSFVARGGETTLIVGYFEQLPYRAYTYLDAFELYESTSEKGCESDAFAEEDDDIYNLVPNSGFEQLYACPSARSDLPNARAWRVAENSPDFYHTCGTGTAAVPVNELGEQTPHNGNGYGGIWAMLKERNVYREFVSTRLQEPLEAGKSYCLSIWVSLAEVSDHALDQMQLLITRSDEQQQTCQVGVDTSTLTTLRNGQILDNWQDWVFLHGTFVARGGEQTIMIGNFRNNDDPHMHSIENKSSGSERFPGSCYYYIDDVSLHALGSPTCSCPESIAMAAAIPLEPAAQSQTQTYDVGDTLVLHNLQFEFDRSVLLPASFPILDSLADFLRNHSDLRIRITGYTDDLGEDEYNRELSERRASVVMDYLVGKGIPAGRMSSLGRGESSPVASNATEEGRASNRRVEVEFLGE